MAGKSKKVKVKKWRVRQDFPKSMPKEIMEFIDPFIAKDKEEAAFKALNFLGFSLYRDKEMKKNKRTALNILTALEFAVVGI